LHLGKIGLVVGVGRAAGLVARTVAAGLAARTEAAAGNAIAKE